MKRSEHLIPLSHDHHRGLAFAKKLREGLDGGADIDRLREEIAAFWDEHLQPHFELEEAHLLPELRRLRATRLSQQLQREHRQIAQLCRRVRDDYPAPRTTLSVLAEAMATHIRFEERELFPFLEKHLGDETLARIGRYLQEEPNEAEHYESA